MSTHVLRRALRRQRARIGGGVALLCLHQTSEALVPVAIGVIIDRAVAPSDTTALLFSLAGLAALFTVLALAYRFGSRQVFAAIEHEAYAIRVEIAERALDPRGHRSGLRDGEVLTIAASDTDLAAQMLHGAGMAFAATTALVVAAVALIAVDLPLGLGVLVAVPLVLLAMQRLAPLLTRRSETQQAALATTNALASDLVTGLRVLRGLNAQHHAARRYATASRDALTDTLRAATAKGLHLGLVTAVNGLLLAAITGVAGWLALRGRLTVGELVSVVGLAQFIAEPVQTLGHCLQILATARASAGRVARVVDAAPAWEVGTLTAPPPASVRLTISGLTYGPLRRVDLSLGAGEVLAVLAHDPRDAEALVTLLAGAVARDDYQGTILIDGALHAEPHHVTLFEGTLRANLGGDDRHLRSAAAEDIRDGHPDGLDQVLIERGANLSGGQRQRVALARAFAAEPAVLVLHDPTTSVDAVTESLIAERLPSARPAPRATLIVTSSPALLGAADRVVVLDDGRIVAEDTHERLLAADPRYRETVLR
ncbi:ABC transporter ATP-binding protein [Actinoplanes sp. NPDC051851]|uniref:ABC transporter ATP-binding protein n=1 Tax=Actinoplanes sp. NPDC051851 TaxID=3154753 RepID=UPI003449904E